MTRFENGQFGDRFFDMVNDDYPNLEVSPAQARVEDEYLIPLGQLNEGDIIDINDALLNAPPAYCVDTNLQCEIDQLTTTQCSADLLSIEMCNIDQNCGGAPMWELVRNCDVGETCDPQTVDCGTV